MKALDTVMSKEQFQKAMAKEGISVTDKYFIAMQGSNYPYTYKYITERQAETSFPLGKQAGIMEVIEFLVKNGEQGLVANLSKLTEEYGLDK